MVSDLCDDMKRSYIEECIDSFLDEVFRSEASLVDDFILDHEEDFLEFAEAKGAHLG